MRILSRILPLLLAFPLFAELPIAAPTLRAATGLQFAPVVAGNGSDALAAWTDERGGDREVYASRIDAAGVPALDFDVTPSNEDDRNPAIVWNGDEYVVMHLLPARFGFKGGLRFTRVKPDDAGDNRLIVSEEIGGGPQLIITRLLSLAWNGESYLALVSSPYIEENGGVWGLLVDRSFHPIGNAFRIGGQAAYQGAAASNGSAFLVTYVEDRLVRVATVSAGGAVGLRGAISEEPGVSQPAPTQSLIWDGQRYVVSWTDSALRVRFLDRDGAPIAPAVALLPRVRSVQAAWNGSEYLLAFITEGQRFDVYGLRIDREGNKLDAEPFPIAASDASQTGVAVTAIGKRFYVAWSDEDSIRSSTIDGAVPSPQSIVARSLGSQLIRDGIFDGTNYAFAWTEENDAYFGRVAPDGRPLDAGGIRLGGGDPLAIAWNGEQYVIPFTDGATGHVARLDRDGHALGTMETPRVAAIATDGRDFLLLSYDVHAIVPTILTAQGQLLPQANIPDGPQRASNVSVAWDGSHYVAIWQQSIDADCYKCLQHYEVHTVLLDRAGRVASPVRSAFADATYPLAFAITQIASGNGNTIAMFGGASTAHVVHIDGDGVPAITDQITDGFYPGQILWTGSGFLAAAEFNSLPAMRISADGRIEQRFVLSPKDGGAPRFVAGAPQLTIAYDRPATFDGHGTIRRSFFDFVEERRRRAR